jgi:hypothetical protein
MKLRLADISDTTLALSVGFVGALSMGIGVSMHRNPFSALPGYDAAITMGILGFVLAILHGLPYRRVLFAMAPIVAIQIVGGQRYRASVFALVGLQLALFGIVGLVMSALYNKSVRDKLEAKAGGSPNGAKPRPA